MLALRKLIPYLVALLAIAFLVVSANFAQLKTIEHIAGRDAERKALQWASYLADAIPGIGQLIATGDPTPDQAAVIGKAVDYGDVFNFALFDKAGQGVLSTSQPGSTFRPEVSGAAAANVMRTGKSEVSLSYGTAPDQPSVYAAAYVPVRFPDGSVVGAAAVLLDQTEFSGELNASSFRLAMVLTTVFTTVLGLLFAAYFIKERQEKLVRGQVDYLATYDQLSNLYNRAGFNERLNAIESGGDASGDTAVLWLDVDRFKLVNDTYGHDAGDAVLQHVGQAVSRCLEGHDIAGRLGGDEFVVVARRPDAASACLLAEQLRALVAEPIHIDGTTVTTSISVGVHFGGDARLTLNDRMTKADLALYQAKTDGRNTSRLFTNELEITALRRRKVEAAIRSGMEDGRFLLRFQPLMRQSTKECVGFEALLRLTDVAGDSIEPAEFIPIAESIGAVTQIGARVLRSAVEAACEWPEHLFVAVNLSARQFDDGKLVETIRQILADTGLDPGRLELEVTESLLMENTSSVETQLAALRDLGVSIAMDDFGTGYSSLGYLWKFGFDKLKIDRSFIVGLQENSTRARDILDTIIALGHRLNMVVTAEGIENEVQADILSGLACDQFQGFLYGEPMPQSDLKGFVTRNALATGRPVAGIAARPAGEAAGDE